MQLLKKSVPPELPPLTFVAEDALILKKMYTFADVIQKDTDMDKEIDWGYCWELCNIATDDILLEGDTVPDWDKALEVCKKCGRYSGESESP